MNVLQPVAVTSGAADFDKFRLRRFAEHLAAFGEAEVVELPVELAVLAGTIA
jgi:hypothetical protein